MRIWLSFGLAQYENFTRLDPGPTHDHIFLAFFHEIRVRSYRSRITADAWKLNQP